MGRSLSLLLLGLYILTTVGSCTRRDGASRDLATENTASVKACGQITKKGYEEELTVFKNLTRSERGIAKALAALAQAAKPMGLDRNFGVDTITLEMFLDQNKEISYSSIEDFTRQVLYVCDVVRNGEAYSPCVRKNDSPEDYKSRAAEHEKNRLAHFEELKKEYGEKSPDYLNELKTSLTYDQLCGPYMPNAFKEAEKFCGNADKYLPKKKRVHPDLLREWIDPDANVEISINDWVVRHGGLWDAQRDDWAPIDKAVTACEQFQTYQNAEDSIEHLFLCFGAFNNAVTFYRLQTDQLGYLLRDKNKEVVLRERKGAKKKDEVLKTCLSGYLKGAVTVDQNNAPEPNSTQKSDSAKQATTSTSSQSSSVTTPQVTPAPTPTPVPKMTQIRSDIPTSVSNSPFSKSPAREKACLPGDNPMRVKCQSSDACVRNFAFDAEKKRIKLPEDLDTKAMLSLYKEERDSFTRAMSKHQAELLALGYITMAFQRDWDVPAQYNRNLDEFTSSCGNPAIVAALGQKMKSEKINEASFDGAYDGVFAAQRSNAESLGQQMIEATRRIGELRKYATILKRDSGTGEITTKIPSFMPPELYAGLTIGLPAYWPFWAFFHYVSGQDLFLNTGAHTNYQCNMFSDLFADDWVTRTERLLTDSDRAMRKKWLDQYARDRAFCERDAEGRVTECVIPQEFKKYINNTDPASFNSDVGRQKYFETTRAYEESQIKEADKKVNAEFNPYERAKLVQKLKERKRSLKFAAMKLTDVIDYKTKNNQKYRDMRMDVVMRDKVLSADEIDFMLDYEQAENETMAYQIRNRDWCRMRYDAAQELVEASIQLSTLYPALAHAIPNADGRSGEPYIAQIDKRLKQIEQDRSLDEAARKKAYDKLAKEISAKAQEILPKAQDNIKKYVTKVCRDMNFPVSMESTFEATLNGSLAAGFEYCDGVSDKKAGLTCQERMPFLACKLGKEARSWYDDKQRPRFYQELGMTLLDVVPALGAASGALRAAFTVRGVVWGGATGLAFTAGNHALSRHIARKIEGRWVDHNNAVAAMALEGVDSYTNSIATMAALTPPTKTKDFLFGFVMGAAASGMVTKGSVKKNANALEYKVSNKLLGEITAKVNDFADGKITRTDLNDYLIRKTGEYPELLDDLPRNMAEQLSAMSDGIYARTFGGGKKGALAATRARQTMGTYFRRNAVQLYKALDRIKSEIRKKEAAGEKLSDIELALAGPTLDLLDLTKFIDKLGPREVALLGREVENFLRRIEDAAPKKQAKVAADFLQKMSGLEIACGNAALCSSIFRTRFYALTHPLKTIRAAAEKLLEKATRAEVARSKDVADHLKQFDLEMKQYAKTHGLDEATAFERYGKILEEEIALATQNHKTYPTLAKLLAALAYRSPNLRNNLMLSLENYGAARWRYRWRALAYLDQSLRTAPRKVHKWMTEKRLQRCLMNPQCTPDTMAHLINEAEAKISEKGAPITEGRRILELFMHRLRIPERKMISSKDFPLMIEELNGMLIQMHYPDGLWVPWAKAFGRAATIKENWNVVRYVAEQVERDSHARWKAIVQGTEIEVWGKPRREAMEHILENGLVDWIVYRSTKVANDNKLKNSYMQNAAFKAEAEQLSLEVMVVLKPIIGALGLYAINEGIDWFADYSKPQAMTAEEKAQYDDIRNNPEKYRERNPKMVLDALKTLEEDIEINTLLLRELEKDLNEGQPPAEEAKLLREEVELTKRTLKQQNELKEQTLRQLKLPH